MKPLKMRSLDFLLPRVGDSFSREVASSEFSSRDHSGKGVDHLTSKLKEKPGGQMFLR